MRRVIRRLAASAVLRALRPIRSFVGRRQAVATVVERFLYRFPVLDDAIVALVLGDPQQRYERWISAYDTLQDADLRELANLLPKVDRLPPLTVVVDGRTVPEPLDRSLREQTYASWMIAESLNSASTDFVVLIDRRYVVRRHALVLFARTIDLHPDATVVYADEDVISADGTRSHHDFKPDWDPSLFRAQNYFGGVVLVRRSSVPAGAEIDGDLWDLLLRVTAAVPPKTIHHLPFVLAHRRADTVIDSSAQNGRSHEQRLRHIGVDAHIDSVGCGSYLLRYELPERRPLVSVVVPSTCDPEVLGPCVDGVLGRTSYEPLELLIVANGIPAAARARYEYVEALARDERVAVLFDDERPYNFARLNNRAIREARGELVCFLNDDTEVIAADWLSAMVAEVLQDGVAAVGAKLIFPNGRIQHGGVILGVGYVAGHAYARKSRNSCGYHDRAVVSRDASCVTAACMVVRRDVFVELGGFDEALAVAFNDVDFCLRLYDAGWRIVWTPAAELYHRESASIGRHNARERDAEWASELELMHSRWGRKLRADPYYNANLSLDAVELWQPAFPPRVAYPWREAGSEEAQVR